MAKKQIAPDHPAIEAWLRAKKTADTADAKLKSARKDLEQVLPPGTPVPGDFPVFWQESQRLLVPDMAALPAGLTTERPDTEKIHAYATLHGSYPAGVDFEASYSLKARPKK